MGDRSEPREHHSTGDLRLRDSYELLSGMDWLPSPAQFLCLPRKLRHRKCLPPEGVDLSHSTIRVEADFTSVVELLLLVIIILSDEIAEKENPS